MSGERDGSARGAWRRRTYRSMQHSGSPDPSEEPTLPPAARVTDMHTCPAQTPGTPPIPHVGGPITGPGAATVLIGGMPASVVGDMAVCVGPPDTVTQGSKTVMIMGRPAVRIGDPCAHGGAVVMGFPMVEIGG